MRLDLEEFDFTVEYLRGKNNFVADALSRIIRIIKNLCNNKVLKMTTRSSKEMDKDTNTFQNKSEQNIGPKISEVINNTDVRKFIKLKATSNHCSLKYGKHIIEKISVPDIFVNEKVDLGEFLPKLQRLADKNNIKKKKITNVSK